MTASWPLALAAGLVAAVNPCGFALTGAMTLGFVAVFGGFGLLAAPVAGSVARAAPWLGIAFGLALPPWACG